MKTLRARAGLALLASLLGGCAGLQAEIDNSILGWRMGFAALSGESVEMMSAVPETTKRAETLARNQTMPNWEVTFPDYAADLVHFLDNERVLVGAIEVGAYLGVPDFKDIHLYGLRDGKVIWKAPRPTLYRGQYAVVATQPHIVLAGFNAELTHFLALDATTGKERWRTTLKEVEAWIPLPRANRIAVLARAEGAKQVSAFELDSGTLTWRRPLPQDGPMAVPTRLVADGDDLFTFDAAATRISASDGALLWQTNPFPAAERVPEFAIHPTGLAAWVDSSIAWLDRPSGKALWRGETDGTVAVVAVGKQRLYCVTRPIAESASKTPRDRLAAWSIDTGRTAWSQQLGGTVESNLSIADPLLVFSTDSSVVGLDAGTGAEAFRTEMQNAAFKTRPPSRSDPPGLPDVLEVRDGVALVVRDTAGGLAVRIDGGKPLWEYVHGNLRYTNERWANEVRMANQAMQPTNKTPAKPAGANNALRNHQLQAHQARMQSWESMRQDAHRRAHDLKSAPASTAQREAIRMNLSLASLASHGKLAEAKYQIMAERSAAGRELAASLTSLAGATRAAVQQTTLEAAVSRILLEKANAELLHSSSLQGRYFLRPYVGTNNERGVALVDTESGKRRDLVHSPVIFHAQTVGLELPFAALSPDGSRMLVLGVGLRPQRWETVVNQAMRIPRAALMAFDMPLPEGR